MKRVPFFLGLAVCMVLFLAASATSTFAQETGSVTGIVTDPQGATVAGADVTLTDLATKNPRTTTTNESGRYHFASIPAGLYDVVISKSGFKVYKAAAQKVSVASQLTVDVALEVGSLAETVMVTSQAGSDLQTANATIGNTINLKQLDLLPNLGRDASSLLLLQPGVTAANAAGQGGGFVAGAYNDQNTFTIDGGNNSDDMAGNTVGYIVNFTGATGTQTNGMASGIVPTPMESVEEFRVNTVGQTADFGSSIGAQVQMVTKRGTDQWHGSGYGYYFAPNLWGANSWVNNHTQFVKGISPTRNLCAAGTTYQSGDNNCVMQYSPIIPNHRERFGFTVGGPAIPWKILGGKTFLFLNYEGFRYQNVALFERNYPTAALRAGVIQVADASGVFQPINLTPNTVTVQVGNPTATLAGNQLRTVTLAPWSGCATPATCDPRLLGYNPVIKQLWNQFLPVPNDVLSGDQFNTQGYLSTLRAPLNSNTYVGRIDHDFGSKHRFFASYRGEKLVNFTTNQVDVGGLLGGTLGTYNATAPRPQTPELLVMGLTSTLGPTITNDFRVSYLWNWWQWSTAGSAPQLPGLTGALEIATAGTATNAEATTAMIPYNVNNQSVRQRVWDGQDKMLRDDVTWVKGNHLLQFGGLIQRNFDYHTRTDNGGSINNAIVYQIAANQIGFTGFFPAFTGTAAQIASQQSSYKNLASSVLGLVGLTQVMYTRGGSDLHLLPLGTFGVEQSTIKTYNLYGSDTWKISPSVTINFGMGYTYETPPVEKFGNQVELVYADGSGLVHTADYLAKRQAAALAGTVYNPTLAFQTTASLGIKYPYTPFRKGFSPRISVAWNPSYKSGLLGKLMGDGKTVVRGGYGRIYGRLNGVNQVLVPLLGPGVLQAVSCGLVSTTGCLTSGTVTPSNVFRIGTDGLTAPLPVASATLPQPFIPGVGGNVQAGDSTVLDPDYKPESTDNVDFTIQRQISRKVAIEVGYIGRRIRNEFQEIDLNAVPYMTTLGGQSFAKAYAGLYTQLNAGVAANAVTSQPFFEAALARAGGTFCTGFANCTVAVASNATISGAVKAGAAAQVWNGLAAANSWILPASMLTAQATSINTTTSLGFGNYNAAFATLKVSDWHNITAISNFTWGRALGTAALGQYNSSNTALDPWNLRANYGPQNFDYQFIFNAGVTYQPTSFFGLYDFRSKHGIVGHLLKGWSVSPFFIAQSGTVISVGYTESNCSGCQAFGENGAPGVASLTSTGEGAVFASPYTGGNSLHRNVIPATGIGSNNSTGLSMFADPAAVFAEFRPCILGIDTSCSGYGNLRGLPRWNMDMTIGKDLKFGERIGLRFTVQFTNVMNHFQASDPSLNLSGSSQLTFGKISGQAYAPRNTEFGLKLTF